MADPNIAGAQPDLDLIGRVLDEQPEAVDAFLARLQCVPGLVRNRAKRVGVSLRDHEVQDTVQNAVLVIWKKLPEFDGRGTLETWFYGIVVYEVLKQRAVHFAATDFSEMDEENHPIHEDQSVDGEAVRAAVDRLGPPGGEIVRLKHFECLSFVEIATRLDMPAKTVMSNYYRTIDCLRFSLRTQNPGGEQ